MPKPQAIEEKSIADERLNTLNQIVKARLDVADHDSGESLRDAMKAQGVEMVDYDKEYKTQSDESRITYGDENTSKTLDEDELEAQAKGESKEDAKKADEIPDTDSRQPKVNADGYEDAEPVEEETDTVREDVYKRDGEWYTQIRVDGADQEIPLSKLKRSAQKETAADKRFTEAAEMRAEADRRLEQAQKLKTQYESRATNDPTDVIESRPKESQEPSGRIKDDEIRQEVQEIVSSIAYGEEDDATDKLTKLLLSQRGRSEPATEFDLDLAQQLVTTALDERDASARKTVAEAAQDRWDAEYDDISTDEDLRNIAATRAQYLAGKDPNRDVYEIFAEAGDFARAWRDGVPPIMEQSEGNGEDTDTSTDRKARKRATAAPATTPASKPAGRVPPPRGRPSSTSIIDSMREHRGQNF